VINLQLARVEPSTKLVESKPVITKSWLSGYWQLSMAGALALVGAVGIVNERAIAQLAPDATLGAERSQITSNGPGAFQIDGGATRGTNLFHSFSQFSIPTGGSAFFNNAANIQNIISRVTGGSVSSINGLIRANGTANLFVINPSGIIFGPNASLNIGGSFLASTASSLNFADGTAFSATAHPTTPLLTISVPIGLQFGLNPGSIQVQGNGQGLRTTSSPVIDTNVGGLRVLPNQTLAMVGGDVALSGGTLKTAGGRLELGSVDGPSLVSLTPIDKGWALGYGGVPTFGSTQLSGTAAVDASGEGGGDVQVQAARVTLQDGSQIEASTLGAGLGGTLAVRASDAVEISGTSANGASSALYAEVYPEANGAGGNLTINTGRLSISGGGQVATSTFGIGNAGNLAVNASALELSNYPSGLFSTVARGGLGNGGNISIRAGSLSLTDGALLSATTDAQGNAGNVNIDVRNAVTITGADKNSSVSSQILSSVQAEGLGNAGDINIKTRTLTLTNGGEIGANVFRVQGNVPGGRGKGGSIQVDATESVNISGVNSDHYSSGLFTDTERGANGSGGNIKITTSAFRIADGAVVSAQTLNPSDGGNITINANTFEAANGGQVLTGTFSSGRAGNITVNATDSITLSGIDPTYTGRLAQSNRDVVSNEGPASGLFATTDSSSTGNGGSISIDPNQLTITDGASIAVNSQGSGNAGFLQVQANSVTLNNGASLTATAYSGEGGNIRLNVPSLLLMRHNSNISTTAGNDENPGNGGNITINSPFILANPAEDTDISANAFTGNGGKVTISAQGIFGIQFQKVDTPESDITASSTGGGINGTVNLNISGIDPSRGLVALPAVVVDNSRLIAQGCAAGDGTTGSKFIVTGRGGLPPNPGEPLSSDAVWSDARLPTVTIKKHRAQITAPKPSSPAAVPIVPATGWVFNGKGEVTLTASAPTEPLQIPWITPASCHAQ